MDLKDKRVVVTGSTGFIGGSISVRLAHSQIGHLFLLGSEQVDLRDRRRTEDFFKVAKPDIVIHCAALYGGLPFNQSHPGKIMHDNFLMSINTIEASRVAGVERFVFIGSASAYPGYVRHTLKEQEMWAGPPNDSILGYGAMKRSLITMVQMYSRQYQFPAITVIPPNVYGPRDTYEESRSHVVAALIRRFIHAERNGIDEVVVYGTGRPVRDFIYVEDLAEGVYLATQLDEDCEVLNIGSGKGVSIGRLAVLISEVVGYEGKIKFNSVMSDGQAYMVLDTSRMKLFLDWSPSVSLRRGLKLTVDWYREHHG